MRYRTVCSGWRREYAAGRHPRDSAAIAVGFLRGTADFALGQTARQVADPAAQFVPVQPAQAIGQQGHLFQPAARSGDLF